MKTAITRSTETLATYARTADKIGYLAKELKQAEKDLRELLPAVLDQIGDRRSCTIDGTTRTFLRVEKLSVSREGTDEELVSHVRDNGLTGIEIGIRSPEYVAPATLRKAVLDGIQFPEYLVSVKTTLDVTVT